IPGDAVPPLRDDVRRRKGLPLAGGPLSLAAAALLAACAIPRGAGPAAPSPWAADMTAGRAAAAEGRLDEAARRFSSSAQQALAFGAGDPRRSESLSALAGVYSSQGKHDEAEKGYEQALGAAELAAKADPHAPEA